MIVFLNLLFRNIVYVIIMNNVYIIDIFVLDVLCFISNKSYYIFIKLKLNNDF